MSDTGQGDGSMSRVGRLSLVSFIAFLSLSALFAIGTVLFGEFGDFEFKVLGTTTVIAFASICALCHSAYAARAARLGAAVGGLVLAITTAAMLIAGIWTEPDSVAYWKTVAVLSIFTLSSALASALLCVRLGAGQRWLRAVTVVTIAALAILGSGGIIREVEAEWALRTLATLGILVALETLVIPITGKLTAGGGGDVEKLALTRRDDGLYEDKQGRLYEVKEKTGPDPGPA